MWRHFVHSAQARFANAYCRSFLVFTSCWQTRFQTIRRAEVLLVSAPATIVAVAMHRVSCRCVCVKPFCAFCPSSICKRILPWLLGIYQLLANKVANYSASWSAFSQCSCSNHWCGYAQSKLSLWVCEGILCIQPKLDLQTHIAVASQYIWAAGKQVLEYPAAQIAGISGLVTNSTVAMLGDSICRPEVKNIRCIQTYFNLQMLIAMARQYISAACKQGFRLFDDLKCF